MFGGGFEACPTASASESIRNKLSQSISGILQHNERQPAEARGRVAMLRPGKCVELPICRPVHVNVQLHPQVCQQRFLHNCT